MYRRRVGAEGSKDFIPFGHAKRHTDPRSHFLSPRSSHTLGCAASAVPNWLPQRASQHRSVLRIFLTESGCSKKFEQAEEMDRRMVFFRLPANRPRGPLPRPARLGGCATRAEGPC